MSQTTSCSAIESVEELVVEKFCVIVRLDSRLKLFTRFSMLSSLEVLLGRAVQPLQMCGIAI
jgi:hypothetical protein